MYKPRDLKGGLFRLALAVLSFWWAWEHWQQIAALEAGADITVKMWAPLAWIYNNGGVWTSVAKWIGQVCTVFFGFVLLVWGASDLRHQDAAAQADHVG